MDTLKQALQGTGLRRRIRRAGLASLCREHGGVGSRVCAKAAREIGRRTAYTPFVMPLVMLLLLYLSPSLLSESWLLLLALMSALTVSSLARVGIAARMQLAEQELLVGLVKRYQLHVSVVGLSWSVLFGLLVIEHGVSPISELALIGGLAVTAGAFATLAMEYSLWFRFIVSMWLPSSLITLVAAIDGVPNAWYLLLIQVAFGLVAAYQGQRVVAEYLDGLLAQARLEEALREIDEQRGMLDEASSRVHRLCYYDPLTGIGSRHHFFERLDAAVRFSQEHGRRFALLHLDLDGFKDINDTFGHEAGDHLLKVVSHRVSELLRSSDFSARLGSDDLALLISNVDDGQDISQIAQRCLEQVHQPVELAGKQIRPRASIGVAIFPDDGNNPLSLLKASESALHTAKANGKHQTARYSPDMSIAAEKRITVEQELRQAIKGNQFTLYYQPQIDARNGCICGVEALVRWQHPEKGLLSPSDFIPVAEERGLIEELGTWVLHQACRQSSEWLDHGFNTFPVAVNISPLQLRSPRFVATVVDALASSGLEPGLLELEITESAMHTDECMRETLQQIRNMGVRIAIDDFGTGYSSLASLKELPVQRVKIDRMFVSDMLSSEQDARFLGSMIDMAHVLGCDVVAEGVEDEAQIEHLCSLECDCLQGFYFSKPVPAWKISALNRMPRNIEGMQEKFYQVT